MIKKYRIWYFIKYYHLIFYFVFAVVLLFSKNFIVQLCCNFLDIADNPLFYHLLSITITLLLMTLWGFIFCSTIRKKTYLYKTGRNLRRDLKNTIVPIVH